MESPNSDEIIAGLVESGTFKRVPLIKGTSAFGVGVILAMYHDKIPTLVTPYYTTETRIMTLCGGAASGKSTLADAIAQGIPHYLINISDNDDLKDLDYHAEVICTDAFQFGNRDYRRDVLQPQTPLEKYNFDYLRQVVAQITTLVPGQNINVPVYNPVTAAGIPVPGQSDGDDFQTRTITGKVDLLIVEGDFQPLDEVDFAIYLHVSDDVRLQRRIERDAVERGYTDESAIVETFNQRQIEQHFPYTLPVASQSDWLLVEVDSRGEDDEMLRYDMYNRSDLF